MASYSRPTTRQVDYSGRVGAGPGGPKISLPSSTPMSAAGAYLDNRNPERAYNSRIQQTAEITNFIGTLIGDKNSGLTKLITEQVQADAKTKAGEFMAEQRIEDVPLMDQPRWRELNPMVRKDVLKLEGQRSAAMAGTIYNAEIASRPILQQPSEGNPELQQQQATARAEAMAIARERSGYGALPGYTQLESAPALLEVTTNVDGQIYAVRAKNADAALQRTEVNRVSSAIQRFEDNSAQFESTNDKVAALRQLIQAEATSLAERYPTADVADLLTRAIAEQLPGIIDGNDELNLTLADLKALSTQEIIVNGENIWDIEGKKGKSLRLRLSEEIQRAGNLRDQRTVGLAAQQALIQSQAGDIDGAIDTITAAGLDVSNPANVKMISEAFSTIRVPMSNAQNARQMEFWNQQVQGKSWKDLWPEIVAAGKDQSVSAQFVAEVGRRIQQGDDSSNKTANAINSSYSRLQQRGELGLAENAVLAAAAKIGVNDQKDRDQLVLQLRGKYAEIVEEKVAADPNYDIAGNMSEDLEEARDFLVEGLSKGPSNEVFQETVGPAKAATELSLFRQAAESSNGRLTDALFSPYITDLAKTISGDDNPTIKDKTKALVNLLTSVKGPDGKPLYPNREAAVKAVRDALNGGKDKQKKVWEGYGEFNFQTDYSAPTMNEAEQILKDEGVELKEDGSNSEQVGTTLTEVSLRSLGGAKDAEAKLLNPEGYKALLASFKGTPMPLDTAAPQLDPNAEARIIPTFFGSQNDEMFIAIGINEGTRTADGGYTRAWNGHKDPGDGHLNRGTVSGGRGNRLSPGQVDKQWRGILAQTAVGTAPVLRQMGLSPGTVAYNNVMFNALDLRVQAPAALPGFLQNINASQDFTLEGIAKARADAYFNPATGRLDTTFSSYNVLLRDQRSRAGALQFRRRV